MEKIIEKYLREHSGGVLLGEMEENLRQSRLRLGFVASKLINEGRIQKVENRYYPTASLLENEENIENSAYITKMIYS